MRKRCTEALKLDLANPSKTFTDHVLNSLNSTFDDYVDGAMVPMYAVFWEARLDTEIGLTGIDIANLIEAF